MAAMADPSFAGLPARHQQRSSDFAGFTEPSNSSFPPESSLAMAVSSYLATTTSLGFDRSLFAENPGYMVNGHTSSPDVFSDDSDMRMSSSALSSTSLTSAPSSAVASPRSNHGQVGMAEWNGHTMSMQPCIVGSDYVPGAEYGVGSNVGLEDVPFHQFEFLSPKSFVDPTMIHSEISQPPVPVSSFDGHHFHHHAPPSPFIPSPSVSSSPQPNVMAPTDSTSPFLSSGSFGGNAYTTSPYGAPVDHGDRRVSMVNLISPGGSADLSSDETKEKQRCTYPDCGRIFKDLKAHMLTHQNERPEKCPIQTCEYHVKGFARKYDKNRHTLTHYKGTMVCGFCPGSGSSAEKSFNRADVFKRHLMTVHGVEQTPPNSRKKPPTGSAGAKKLTGYPNDATGKCSTCSQTFSNAQDFYEHLDDCVLRIVQQEDPAEAINARRLAEVENDKVVHQTLEKNNLPITTPAMQNSSNNDDNDELDLGEDEDLDDGTPRVKTLRGIRKKPGNPVNGVQKSRGLTHSRGGVVTGVKARGRKNRRDYPSSWGFDQSQMTMKKRIMAVFDGPRRLAKDDMMLSTEHEVRIKLSDGKSYVTDLDVLSLRRAEGFHGASDEEKGPWLSDDPTEDQMREMQAMLRVSPSPV